MLTSPRIYTILLCLIFTGPLFSQENLLPPDSLAVYQQCDEIDLTWKSPAQTSFEILGYKVYLGDSLLLITQDTAYMTNMQGNGFITFNVTTLYDEGESLPASIEVELVVYAQPTNLEYISSNCQFTWNKPQGNLPYDPAPLLDSLQWGDNYNYIGIGTGGPVDFEVAAVWSPGMLAEFHDGDLFVDKVSFFPKEQQASYTIRIWQGDQLDSPDDLIYEQALTSIISSQWNNIELDTPVQVDTYRYLWIGYYLNTPAGYPAGADIGPAHDHYGNMMYFGGSWQTLLQINPELDYDWNIKTILLYYTEHQLSYDIYGLWGCYYLDPWEKLNEEPITDTNFFYACILPSEDWEPNNCFVRVNYCNVPVDSDTSTYYICWFSGIEDRLSNEPDAFLVMDKNGSWFISAVEDLSEFSVYDLTGRVVWRQKSPSTSFSINSQSFPKGIYLMVAQTRDKRSIKKVLR